MADLCWREVLRQISNWCMKFCNLKASTINSYFYSFKLSLTFVDITYSSDSTSHKHIEYECRTIALTVVDYANPHAEPTWKSRTLGVDTSINHSSEVQVDGLRKRLQELADVFNNSPLAQREDLRFKPDDFAYRLLGTSGDHAADQKKSHNLLQVWHQDVILQRLGEEALLKMDATRVLAILISLKRKQMAEHGGEDTWNALPEHEKTRADARIVCEIGQQIFGTLPVDKQAQLTRFIRTGCCMHKDLNCVKGGVKAMGEMWGKLKKKRPITLANKDNADVLACIGDGSTLTAAEKRAEEVSKRGGSHATMLGGLICRNKDKKKGQQDIYDFYMERHIGKHIPYPDVSNTRYGSHGKAAATIMVYRAHFIDFMEFVRTTKDKPGHTNIEKNFLNALKDLPTLTKLSVLALYNISVSRPFMKHVRSHGNILLLESFFKRKVDFLQSIIDNPSQWMGDDVAETYEISSLDRKEWDQWSLDVLNAIKRNKDTLPDLDDAIVAFVQGA